MARFSDELLQRIREAAPIEQVVEDYVALRKTGKHLKGLCPFHAEKTPSFTVSPDTGLFYCYGCHKGGNVFTFLMEIESLSFPDAVRQIAERFGVPLPSSQYDRDGMDILTVNRWAQEVFHRFLVGEPAGRVARDYLHERKLTPQSIQAFGLGAASGQWQFLVNKAAQEGVPPDLLMQAGLVIKRRDGSGLLDRFRDRLIFPLHSPSGQVVGFAGRVLPGNPDEAKYVNSPETAAYHKSRFIYGVFQGRKTIAEKARVLLVEGYLDVIRCHEAGFGEAVAVSGTALTAEQVDMLRRKVPEVIVMFDGDSAGVAAAERAVGLLLEGSLPCRIVVLPDGEDPDSFLRTRAAADLEVLVDSAATAIQFLVSRAQEQKTRARDVVHAIGPMLARIPDPLLREEAARELARTLGFTPEAVLTAMGRAEQRHATPRVDSPAERPTAWEEQVCRHLLLRPAERAYILDEISPSDFTNPLLRQLCEWVLAHAGALEVKRVVETMEDPDLRREATRLVVRETPLGPVEKDVTRFRIEKLVRTMRDLRQRVKRAEAAGAARELDALLAELNDVGAAVDGLRTILGGPSSSSRRMG